MTMSPERISRMWTLVQRYEAGDRDHDLVHELRGLTAAEYSWDALFEMDAEHVIDMARWAVAVGRLDGLMKQAIRHLESCPGEPNAT